MGSRTHPPAAPAAGRMRPGPVGPVAGNQPRRKRWKPGTGQLLCWQFALLIVALSLRQPWPVVAAAVAVAAGLVTASAVRLRGRWLYELILLGCRFLLRTRRHDLPERSGTAYALLGALLPGSTTRTVETGQGPVMAISHDQGLTAIIRPRTLTPAQLSSFPSPAELLSGDVQEFGVQIVFHAGAQPGTPIRLWLAVHAPRTVGTATDEELALALRNRLRRIRRALQRAGVVADPLPEDLALAELTGLAHVTGGRTAIREDWRAWRTGPVSQACFAIEPAADLRVLINTLLGRPSGLAVTVTLSAPPGAATGLLLRLAAATGPALEAAADRLTNVLSRNGFHLTRLDGTHSSGVAASLPIGGFPR
ncbi:hypothetical protein LZ318_12890 [Saccharopolyspora indica]|uniref:type VII secretion protein EccE n=1 Tax=Saccharopolyspora indica TaxID=1229659 RepID=UPI0022EB1508|nr:type VII secretion protein EccE [Saccharopolyspora indica]MDA3647209.1 type VII secretion protein EccE [Saccharopolyspora indica]